MKSKLQRKPLIAESDPQGFLFSEGKYRTKILPEDLPKWYISGYLYKRYGFISAKGVKHLLYVPNYAFDNHLYKDDSLFISFDTEIEAYQSEELRMPWYKGHDYVIGGVLIVEFIEAAEKYFGYDVNDIRHELDRKKVWYDDKNKKSY
jgi:hypothetical protein